MAASSSMTRMRDFMDFTGVCQTSRWAARGRSRGVDADRAQRTTRLGHVDVERQDVTAACAGCQPAVLRRRWHGTAVDLQNHCAAFDLRIEGRAHGFHARY